MSIRLNRQTEHHARIRRHLWPDLPIILDAHATHPRLQPQIIRHDPKIQIRRPVAVLVPRLKRATARPLPTYCHGNDAGCDDATPFAEGAHVVTPDLATFLILQLD